MTDATRLADLALVATAPRPVSVLLAFKPVVVADLDAALGPGARVVRAMLNTPVAARHGIAVAVAGSALGAVERRARELAHEAR